MRIFCLLAFAASCFGQVAFDGVKDCGAVNSGSTCPYTVGSSTSATMVVFVGTGATSGTFTLSFNGTALSNLGSVASLNQLTVFAAAIPSASTGSAFNLSYSNSVATQALDLVILSYTGSAPTTNFNTTTASVPSGCPGAGTSISLTTLNPGSWVVAGFYGGNGTAAEAALTGTARVMQAAGCNGGANGASASDFGPQATPGSVTMTAGWAFQGGSTGIMAAFEIRPAASPVARRKLF
jgi:hypothetical protein